MEKVTYHTFGPIRQVQVGRGQQLILKNMEKIISSLIIKLKIQETLEIWYIYGDFIKLNIILLNSGVGKTPHQPATRAIGLVCVSLR
jgi:hypothetical protein